MSSGFILQLTKADVRVGHECEVLVFLARGGRGEAAEAVAAVPAEPHGVVLLGEADAVPLAVGRGAAVEVLFLHTLLSRQKVVPIDRI